MPGESDLDPTQSIQAYIGERVRVARKARGWSQPELAVKSYSNKTTISDVENGTPPDRSLAVRLEDALELGRGAIGNLLVIIENQAVRDYAQDFVVKQGRASLIHAAGFTVPGLLQTADYARDLLLVGQEDPHKIDSIVEARMARQDVWERDDPPWMSAVISEAVLHQAGQEQLERLRDVQELRHISVQFLPFNAGTINGSIYLLSLPDGVRGAYTEGFSTGSYSEETQIVLHYQRVYDRLAASALTAEATTVRITEALKQRFT
ncbi:helix-turn-helix transcriptional regulator [Streptomyces sp. NPDC001941]|uniref:helix-turn-helix domain-containing protein n=1 Tax=Streptomyces sp. NPDC001941 TaxID=3154659 RepID=UPI00332262F6